MIAPLPESVEVVMTWLRAAGIQDHQVSSSLSGDILTVSTSIAVANSLLNSAFHVYVHPGHAFYSCPA